MQSLKLLTRAALVALTLSSVPLLPTAEAAIGRATIERVTDPISGSYIVTLRGTTDLAGFTALFGTRIRHIYRYALNGFSITTNEAEALALSRDPRVARVEEDGIMRAVTTQTGPPWGLDRIDQRNLPLSGSYVYTNTGTGVKAYIIDTGILTTHTQFGGRATHGRDTVNNDNDATDCNGHGTHVAGTVGGSTYGVAKQVSLVAVRVLDCGGSGATSGVIAGIDWVTGNHAAGVAAVANMSLGGGASSTLDTATRNSINDGITYALAAGNGNLLGMAEDACNTSPARVTEAVTVGAMNSSDAKASFSNFGTCLDLFAPGVGVTSSWYTSTTATKTLDGTSMASPHVAGVAAQYLQSNPSASPSSVATALTTNATTGKVTSPGTGSPNRLLYNAFIGGTPPPNQAPTASFTNSCTGLTCAFTDTSTDSDGTIASRSWNFGDSTTSTAANPSKTYAAAGTYTVTLTVTDNSGATGSTSKSVAVSVSSDPDPSTPNLTSGVTRSDTNGAKGTWKYYKISVPTGRTSVRADLDGPACGLLGCSPDLDVFVRQAAKPTTTTSNCKAETGSSDETCTVSNPGADWWYVGVYVYSGSTGASYTIKMTY